MIPFLWFEAVGLALLHFIWQGAVIAGLYKAVIVLRPGLRPQSQYALGLAALLAMAAAGLVTFALEGMRLAATVAPASSGPPAGFDMAAGLPWLDAAWLLGVAGLSARTFRDLGRIQRLSALARPAPEAISRRFAATLARLGLTHRVSLRVHPLINGPFVVGIVRSVVYLPLSAISTLSPDQLDAVIAHELEHIRRADYAWNLVQTAIETLFFYHPLVWWIGARVREQRELCCDDAAVKACRDPMVYATALFSLARQTRGAPALVPTLVMALGYCDTAPSLLVRMGRILGETPVSPPKARHANPGVWVSLILAFLLAGLALVAAHTPARRLPSLAPAVEKPVRTKPLIRVSAEVSFRKPVAAARHDTGRHLTAHPASPPGSSSQPSTPAAPPQRTSTTRVFEIRWNDVHTSADINESVDPHVFGKDVSGGKITYLISGKPNTADLVSMFQKEHLFMALTAPPGSPQGPTVVVSPLSPGDKDYPVKSAGSGDPPRRFKVVVTPIHGPPPAPPPAAS